MNLDINLITQGSQDLIIGNTDNNPIIIINNLITEQTLITQGSQEQIIGKTNNPIIPIAHGDQNIQGGKYPGQRNWEHK